MSDEKNRAENPQVHEPELELSQKELKDVAAGLSLNYGAIQWEYTKQDDTGAAKPITNK
jgi:type VI protein secretion system component Hcp